RAGLSVHRHLLVAAIGGCAQWRRRTAAGGGGQNDGGGGAEAPEAPLAARREPARTVRPAGGGGGNDPDRGGLSGVGHLSARRLSPAVRSPRRRTDLPLSAPLIGGPGRACAR